MPKTLAELRAEKAAKLPTRSERLCLNLELLGEVQRLSAEKADLVINANAAEPAVSDQAKESKARVRKGGERGDGPLGDEAVEEAILPPRVAEIEAELASLWDRMREYEGDLVLRGIDGDAWQTYKDEHPPREDNVSDARHGNNVVNTTDLMRDLGDWAESWEGEPIPDGEWGSWLRKRIAPADMIGLVRRVVEMQESKVTVLPKALSDSHSTTSIVSADA
ncbi:hypothetical protein F9L07_22615 [Pimelobacter simplex]|uniref:Uncharacterized protein n=1 Tax=Nocardioides simplex TaxID=2045 RepID=A0A7J5DTB3_NOCSI|nr:hypothetical protein [Pimelobacter simplex]KAB2808311.1 hypothetical protein F9L07_22615 [Pimelobacter simplex]